MGEYPSPYKHILLSQQFTPEYLAEVFELAERIRKAPQRFSNKLRGKVAAALFYEPSTRTRLSFESAVLRLGGSVISTENAGEFSSAVKGETLEDTVRIVSAYCDVLIIRHMGDDFFDVALPHASVPLINAGSGKTQHPTQALLDVYTIWREFGRLENLKVAVVGDLLRGRTCDSLVYLLSKFSGNSFYFVAPDNCRVKEGIKEHLREHKLDFTETENMEDVLEDTDVLYMTRIQKERFADKEEYESTKGKYVLNRAAAERMRHGAIIMHPLPRVNELAADVDADPRARYFEQAANGLWVRMALLMLLREGKK